MLQKAAVAVCFSFLFTLTVKAQQPSITLVGVEMRLGMAQEEILKRVSDRFVVQLLPDSSASYFIRSRERNSDGEYEFYGGFGFSDGKLTYAQKNWYGNAGRSDYDFADAIYFALAEVEKRGEQVITIRTGSQRQQGYSSESVILVFPKRLVSIRATEYKGSKSVQVSEEIGSSSSSR